jgi:hypothetical protein
MDERWLPVVGREEFYQVSDLGRVRSNSRRLIMKQQVLKGYPTVSLELPVKRRSRVHRLVLEAFVGPCPEGMETRHLDNDRQNNRLSNLAWGTREENEDDKRRHGTAPRGERSGTARLTADQVAQMRAMHATGASTVALGRLFNVSQQAAWKAVAGKTWKNSI